MGGGNRMRGGRMARRQVSYVYNYWVLEYAFSVRDPCQRFFFSSPPVFPFPGVSGVLAKKYPEKALKPLDFPASLYLEE